MTAANRQELLDLVGEFKDYLDDSPRWSRDAWRDFVRRFADLGVAPEPVGSIYTLTPDDLLAEVERVL